MFPIQILYSYICLENIQENNFLWGSKKNTSDYDSVFLCVKREVGRCSVELLKATEYIVVDVKILKLKKDSKKKKKMHWKG